jgi:hypothetical protein
MYPHSSATLTSVAVIGIQVLAQSMRLRIFELLKSRIVFPGTCPDDATNT